MWIVATMITDSRLLAGVDTWNVTDAVAIKLADEIYQELVDLKKSTSESFLHTQAFINTTIYNNEYTLPTWFEKVEKILLASILFAVPTYTAWAASTVYAAWDKCTNGGRSYICNLAHTSTASFPYTRTFTTTAILANTNTITIAGVVFTAKTTGTNCVNPGDFDISTTEALCNANLLAVIQSATAGTSGTFIALSEYNKQLLSDIELVATNPTWSTIVITYNTPITVSETSWVASRWSETGGNRLPLYEWYVPVTPMKIDYENMDRYNEISAGYPIFFFMEDKIRIYPRPTVSVTRWIMLDYVQQVPTLTAIDDDSSLFLENKFLKAWKYWLAYKMLEFCSLDSTLMRSDYEIEKEKAHARWANRYANKVREILPNLSHYMRNGR